MNNGQPTHEQMCKILGSVYSDAVLRIEFLENENKQLRQNQQRVMASMEAMREERDALKFALEDKQKWNRGNENSMLPESLREKIDAGLTDKPCTSSPQPVNSDLSPVKSTGTRDGTPR